MASDPNGAEINRPAGAEADDLNADEGTPAPLVCDASVIAKWFLNEEWSETARTLITSGRAIFAPELMLAELGSIFREKVLKGEMTLGDTGPAFDAVVERVALVSHTETLVDAVALAVSSGRSFYDCLYLALAVALGCRFLTADERFINAMQSGFGESLYWLGDLSLDV